MFKTLFVAFLLQFGGDCPMVPIVEHISVNVPIPVVNETEHYEVKLKWKF